MTSRPAALALSTLVLLAGCTTQPTTASSPTGSPPPTISPAPMSPGSAGSNTPAPPGSTGPAIPAPSGSAGSNTCRQVRPAVTVSDADDGATVCLIVGGELTVSLPGPGWQSPVAQGDLLVPDSTPGAATVTRFRVSRPGPDTVVATRRVCPAGQAARSCHALRAYQIHVLGVAG